MDNNSFYSGICSALAVVTGFDAETIFHEIVATVDKEKLIKHARANGVMKWSGLSKYGYGKQGE